MASRVTNGVTRLTLLIFALSGPAGGAAWAQRTTDPGLNDLVILDPGAHERGLPAVKLSGVGGSKEIDIPPTVHVHRYFYSGDKIYQGPILQGGPTIVVANHPKTGERMYIDVVLPAGAPRIAYTKHSIRYLYNDRRVEIKFQHFPFDPCVAVVKHHHGTGFTQSLRDTRERVGDRVQARIAHSQLVHSATELGSEGGHLVSGVATSLRELTAQGTDSLKTLSNMIPGVVYLKSKSEEKHQQAYESSVEHAQLKKEHHETNFVRTNQ
ncbi:MAG: hypothetical protein ACF788_05915 [Novipirellula sp. JB048]